jgi:hypothetical protein
VQNLHSAMPKLRIRTQAIFNIASDRMASPVMAGTTGMATSLSAENMSPLAPQMQGGSLPPK